MRGDVKMHVCLCVGECGGDFKTGEIYADMK